jgi:hypothetical protein
VDGAAFLASGKADIAFNWAGEQQTTAEAGLGVRRR